MEIKLKEREIDHVKIFFSRTQDDEIQTLFPFSIKSLEEAISLFKQSKQEGATSFGQVIYADDKYIGDVWCYGIDEINEMMAMLSIVIFNKDYWGKGVAPSAIKPFASTVFAKYKINKLGAFTYSSNSRSIGALKKVGFTVMNSFVEGDIESKYLELCRD